MTEVGLEPPTTSVVLTCTYHSAIVPLDTKQCQNLFKYEYSKVLQRILNRVYLTIACTSWLEDISPRFFADH